MERLETKCNDAEGWRVGVGRWEDRDEYYAEIGCKVLRCR